MPLPDNESFNITFVQAVEKYKFLYDTTSPQYISRDEQDKAWNCLAEKFSSTGAECKMRWKHLRGGLTRYIKKKQGNSGQAAKLIKQFYLWDEMKFVLPFLKSRIYTGTLALYSDDTADMEDDIVDHEDDIVCETSKVGPEFPRTTKYDPSPQGFITSSRLGRKRPADNSFERAVANFISKKSGEEKGNPDLQFFRSILPDVAGFNALQKRRFKIKVIQFIDDISNEESASRSSSESAYSGSTDYSYQQHPEAQDVIREPAMRMDPRDPDSYSSY
ncbi:hypothetical protein SK128_023997 [Halocaridina rubra]|uniref:MADF domain-containing protein n=1 Tax=Halocaridina rubra TaxID=373956 RepID=A0AAN8WY87_HALRR